LQQTGPAVLNNAEPDPQADAQTEAGELNATPQPMLQDAEDGPDTQGVSLEPSSSEGGGNIAPVIAPIQLPFPGRTPFVREVPR
jgi:hypothetical protein